MELVPGTRLGRYEIVSLIGAGGMGEVFKARDTRLDRTVAVKVMPKYIAAREDLRARFEREARTVSNLHHPNICILHDIGKQDGADFMVLEFLEGETLAARTAKGPMPLDQVLTYGIQIADALDRAHRSGVSHRDVKPANVMITRDGCKVLDFGLAKTAQKAGTPDDSTLTAELTGEGAIMGTPQYMAPEQYEGTEADARSDIFAFGCVLYEMVTGRRCFEGKTNASLIAAVLRGYPPPMSAAQPTTPASLERLVKRCLEKDPEDRYQSMRDVVLDLKSVGQTGSLPAQAASFSWNRWLTLAAGVLASTLAVLAFIHFRETPSAEPVLHATISTPENSGPRYASISPDDRLLLVSLSGRLNLRSLDSAQFHPIANTDGATNPFWAADGKSIGFVVRGKLKTILATGGSPQTLCDTNFSSGSWSRNGVILYTAPGGQISRVNAAGGACTPVTKPESGEFHHFPTFLPDGRHFVYFVRSNDESRRGIYIAALDEPAGRRLLSDWSGVVYAPKRTGSPYPHLLFLRGSTLMAQPFDERSLQLAGDPLPVVEGISSVANPPQPEVFASAGGILAFVANKTGHARLTWLDRSGKDAGPVGSSDTQGTSAVALSRDGKNVAISRTRDGQESVWVRNFARDSESRLTEPGTSPVWSPDASRIVYKNGNDLFLRDADGGGAETLLLRNANQKLASDWSRDGRFLLYTETDPKTGSDIWYLEDPLGKAGGKPMHFQGTNALVKSQAQFSPDGHWVAYTSNESGGTEVYIRPFPSGSGQRKVSTDGGAQPRWSSDGKEIYYITGGRSHSMMAVDIRPGSSGALEIDVPRKLFESRLDTIFAQFNVFSYAVAPDGRFLVNVSTDVGPPVIEVITNWQKLAAGAKTQ